MANADQRAQWNPRSLSTFFKPKPSWPNPQASTGLSLQRVGSRYCWEAIGPVRRKFDEELQEEVRQYITRNSQSLDAPVVWSVYMIGRRRETSCPVLAFVSRDKRSRQTIRDLIKTSGILEKYRGFHSMDCERPLGFQSLTTIASNTVSRSEHVQAVSVHDTRLKAHSENLLGAKLFVPRAGRSATAGVTLEWHGRYFMLTVAHVFNASTSDVFPHQDSSEEFEYDIDSCDESDEDDGTLMDATSRASMTTEEDDRDGSLDSLWTGSLTSNEPREFQKSQTASADTELEHPERMLTLENNVACWTGLSDVTETSLPGHAPRLEAGFSEMSEKAISLNQPFYSSEAERNDSLDYALAELAEPKVPSYQINSQDYLQTGSLMVNTEVSRCPVQAEIIVVTASSGVIRGRMSGTPSFMQRPQVSTQQELWTIYIDGVLSNGDCGSCVFDAVTGVAYGHIVAGSLGFGSAYIIPLHRVLDDLGTRFRGIWNVVKGQVPIYGSWGKGKEKSDIASKSNLSSVIVTEGTPAHLALQPTRGIDVVTTIPPLDPDKTGATAIELFLSWVSEAAILTDVDRHDHDHLFVPYAALEDYFDRPRVQQLLTAIFPETGSADLPSADQIRMKFLKTFAILLVIGEGSLIGHFIQSSWSDKSLPWETPFGRRFPGYINPRIYRLFYDHQWEFCAAEFKFGLDESFSADIILPILFRSKISSGGSADVYRILVHESYNQLTQISEPSVSQLWSVSESHFAKFVQEAYGTNANTFALKTYKAENAAVQFKNEVDAMRELQQSGHQANIVGFHGSFVYRNTYNLILDFCDTGSLEDFFQTTPQPYLGKDIIDLWRSLFDILKALDAIHGTFGNSYTNHHFDIRPENILVRRKEKSMLYDCNFMIGTSSVMRRFSPRVESEGLDSATSQGIVFNKV